MMITGDAEAPARRVAHELGVGYRARLLPEQKLEAVRELVSKYENVGMVGDGVPPVFLCSSEVRPSVLGAAGSCRTIRSVLRG
jgi:Cd2+/Zn2+-exporting ATPase